MSLSVMRTNGVTQLRWRRVARGLAVHWLPLVKKISLDAKPDAAAVIGALLELVMFSAPWTWRQRWRGRSVETGIPLSVWMRRSSRSQERILTVITGLRIRRIPVNG